MGNKFTVIKGKNNKETPAIKQKWELYKNAYDNLMIKCSLEKENNNNISDTLAKMFFYGTRYITLKYNSNRKGMFEPRVLNREELINDFAFCEVMLHILGHLTIKQLMGIFPIDKEYDGEKYYCKDYFYAMEHLEGVDYDDLICNQFEDIEDFTWVYWNREIFELDAVFIEIASDIRRFEGKKGIVEEWMEEQGIESYTVSTDGTMKNSKGEKICKLKPNSGFKVVKNAQNKGRSGRKCLKIGVFEPK